MTSLDERVGEAVPPRQNNGVLLAMLVFATVFMLVWGGGLAGADRTRWLITFAVAILASFGAAIAWYLATGRRGPRALPGSAWIVGIVIAANLVRVLLPPMWIAVVVGAAIGLALLGLFRVVVPARPAERRGSSR